MTSWSSTCARVVRRRPPAARRPRIRRSCARCAIATSASAATACSRSCPARRPTRACACSTPTAARPRCAATASAASPSCCTTPTRRCTAPPCASRPAPACWRCKLDVEADRVRTVEVDMGRPRLTRDEIPILPHGTTRVLREPISARGRTLSPHGRLDGQPARGDVLRRSRRRCARSPRSFGPLFETAERFPRRTNVEFAHVRPNGEIDLVVWERGSGITLACGTGACATVVAACLEERLSPGPRDDRPPPGWTAQHHRREGLLDGAHARPGPQPLRSIDRRRPPDERARSAQRPLSRPLPRRFAGRRDRRIRTACPAGAMASTTRAAAGRGARRRAA